MRARLVRSPGPAPPLIFESRLNNRDYGIFSEKIKFAIFIENFSIMVKLEGGRGYAPNLYLRFSQFKFAVGGGTVNANI